MRVLLTSVCLLCVGLPSVAETADFPEVRVTSVRRVFHNGEHNAFTDLVRFRGRYYLTFRSCPDGHMVHPTASVIVLSSQDLRDWRPVHQFRVKHRDTRDPHFLVFRDRLFVYTGTWYTGEASIPPAEYDLNKHLGYAVWTADGADWHGPVMLEGTFGHYVWRAATFDGKAFLCGRRKHGFDMRARGEGPDVESVMLESDDGLVWKPRAFFQEKQGDETAFSFEPDGTVVGIARRGRASAQLLRSRPPYADWHRSDLGRYVGGPLLARWGARWVVGGRNMPDGGNPETMLFWLDEDMLRPLARLPSAGDNSYPGFLAISPARAVVSWYSSHEHGDDGTVMTAIYMADLEMLP